jgi:hypothetical protein
MKPIKQIRLHIGALVFGLARLHPHFRFHFAGIRRALSS